MVPPVPRQWRRESKPSSLRVMCWGCHPFAVVDQLSTPLLSPPSSWPVTTLQRPGTAEAGQMHLTTDWRFGADHTDHRVPATGLSTPGTTWSSLHWQPSPTAPRLRETWFVNWSGLCTSRYPLLHRFSHRHFMATYGRIPDARMSFSKR